MRQSWTNAALIAGGGGLALLMILTQTRVQRPTDRVPRPLPPERPEPRRMPGQPDVRQLRVGMHRQVVRKVHGSPAITETNADRTQRWTYAGSAWGSVVVGFSARGLVERIEVCRS